MKSRTAFVLGLALLAGGCASTSKVMLAQPRPAISPDQVMVYFSPPPGRYEEIALLDTSSGGFTWGEQNKMNEVIGKLRVAAAEVGANGVLFKGAASGYSNSSVGVGVGTGSFRGRSHTSGGVGVSISPSPKYASGVAIYVFDPPPPGQRPALPDNWQGER